MNKYFIIFILLAGIVTGCKKHPEPMPQNDGKINIHFVHRVNDNPLVNNSMSYVNEAGNVYEIDELRYFISDVTLTTRKGDKLPIDDQKVIHYVDIDLPGTLSWEVYDPIPEGTYDSISFVFGLTEQRNVSFAFVNPPEVNMFWPDVLGGGYHYLMINGKWLDPQNQSIPFNFHLGIGQIYSGSTSSVDSIIGFVQNYFVVKLPLSGCKVEVSKTSSIRLIMNLENWFKTPHTWDWNYWGGYIMQNQLAMHTAVENGYDVFAVEE